MNAHQQHQTYSHTQQPIYQMQHPYQDSHYPPQSGHSQHHMQPQHLQPQPQHLQHLQQQQSLLNQLQQLHSNLNHSRSHSFSSDMEHPFHSVSPGMPGQHQNDIDLFQPAQYQQYYMQQHLAQNGMNDSGNFSDSGSTQLSSTRPSLTNSLLHDPYIERPRSAPGMRLGRPASTRRLAGRRSSVSSSPVAAENLKSVSSSPAYTPVTVDTSTPRGGKRYVCTFEDCGSRFKTGTHLRRHRSVHSKDRPFPCPFENCSSRFTRQDNLNQHMRHCRLNPSPNSRTSSPAKRLELLRCESPLSTSDESSNKRSGTLFPRSSTFDSVSSNLSTAAPTPYRSHPSMAAAITAKQALERIKRDTIADSDFNGTNNFLLGNGSFGFNQNGSYSSFDSDDSSNPQLKNIDSNSNNLPTPIASPSFGPIQGDAFAQRLVAPFMVSQSPSSSPLVEGSTAHRPLLPNLGFDSSTFASPISGAETNSARIDSDGHGSSALYSHPMNLTYHPISHQSADSPALSEMMPFGNLSLESDDHYMAQFLPQQPSYQPWEQQNSASTEALPATTQSEESTYLPIFPENNNLDTFLTSLIGDNQTQVSGSTKDEADEPQAQAQAQAQTATTPHTTNSGSQPIHAKHSTLISNTPAGLMQSNFPAAAPNNMQP
ncbi:hypothetical protein BATDEDRAFT_25104 [Batrachochytrium dendrobatidis JAM81]|uniref:C2H2-type domain-containing protein n=1 Tax=Batrachochytrium dendrobatidis (strain JAM81 / FGSC 10211) TaxID=684364 RepID=F4P2M0_BATDJ|nr:uncharacterized protein BATDEDRAFT_25104 [Batrachochytrium dendrobatidis JAM81]EGF80235.1 hypothetical protein BATDEDRAFT_25104 [Batrachochytrium dendrobatidis JAM81]|eukprot:XP_006679017.1 hypothetical protein BATDEDRAFT_25104 [Batrachochytrium dendrobatidis JAM81]